MAAKVQPQVLSNFLGAMQSVYGPFDTLTAAQATVWTPPPMVEGHRGRYLWTDAFGVLNMLTLGALTGGGAASAYGMFDRETRYTALAARLIDAMHDTLGRTRNGTQAEEDDSGGDGDGQYHHWHYLALWMFALNQLARASGERLYNDLAVELARAIHPRFVHDRESPRPRMYWKMSVDLRRPVVRSRGNPDPIDGYVVFSILQRSHEDGKGVLAWEISDYKRILETKWRQYASNDPLDLSMTLWTAHWFDEREKWADELTRRAVVCLRALYEEEKYFDAPTRFRLAFREFGTCLGARCHMAMLHEKRTAADKEKAHLEALVDAVRGAWAPHLDRDPPVVKLNLRPITMVMYAAALVQGAFQRGFFREEL